MSRCWLVLVLVVSSCGKGAEQQAREDVDREMAARGETPKKDTATEPVKPLPPKKEKEKPPDEPEPTTPAEIDAARKRAMIAGKAKDVIRYCEMSKFDDKADPQALLGCTVAACRENDVEKARAWAKPLQKAFRDQAVKTCLANKVAL